MTFAPWASRLTAPLAVLALSSALLLGCGGGTSQVDPFKPTRLLAFGDELSLLTPEGKKYTVNALDTADAIQCSGNLLWTQTVASYYGMTFSQCNPNKVTDLRATTLATVGAGVDEFLAQVSAFEASNSFTDTDLITVMVGVHDVEAAYAKYPAQSAAALTAEVQAKGQALAQKINALTAKGPRVLVSTIMDISLSPWALSEEQGTDGAARRALLVSLTKAFNDALLNSGSGLVNDGSKIGLLLASELSQAMAGDLTRGGYGIANATAAACSTTLPDCTTKTMGVNANAATYLWADDRRPGYVFHNFLGNQALARLRTLPF